MTIADLEEAALQLSIEERAHLMWLQEARRRAEEIDQGKVQLVSGEELEQRVQSMESDRAVRIVRQGSFSVAVPIEPSERLTEETVERVRNELREHSD